MTIEKKISARLSTTRRNGVESKPVQSNRMALVPYTMLVRQFKATPSGKLYCLHGSSNVFRLSLSVVGHALLKEVPIALVDGTNRFDVYHIAEFARKYTTFMSRQPGGRRVDPDQMLRKIFVSRAFTCYQMEATLTERLPAFVKRIHSPVAIIFGLLDTFYDEQAPLFEVRASLQRIIVALRRLKQENISILLASLDVQLASKERNGLFPKLKAAMDRVFYVTEDERGQRILHESQEDFGRMKGGNRTLNRYSNPKSQICKP